MVMRCTSVPLLAVIAAFALNSRRSQPSEPTAQSFSTSLIVLIVVIGIFDVSANLLFGLATVSGALPVVAVLGSLYPATTVLLARVIDHERMSGLQDGGVFAAIAGVAMIAAGS
jgi:drug/metabolite transporter (DMT)-like permease